MASALARRRGALENEVEIREHRLIVDEPHDRGGGDAGPTPTEMLAGALASCTNITLLMYAGRKGWELGELEVSAAWASSEEGGAKIEVEIRTPAEVELTDEQRQRLLTIAGKCPVHKLLAASDVEIEDSLEMMPS